MPPMDSGPLSPDSADFMALLEKHLAANESQQGKDSTAEQQEAERMFRSLAGGDEMGDEDNALGRDNQRLKQAQNTEWYGNIAAGLMYGFPASAWAQQGQGQYTGGRNGAQNVMGGNMTLSPDSDVGLGAGLPNLTNNYFGQGNPRQTSSSSASTDDSYAQRTSRTSIGAPRMNGDPAQTQMANYLTEMAKSGNFDVNAMKQMSILLQAQAQAQSQPQPQWDSRANPHHSSSATMSTNTFGGIPAASLSSNSTTQPTPSAQEMLRALQTAGLWQNTATTTAPPPDMSSQWQETNQSVAALAAMISKQNEQQRQQRAIVPAAVDWQSVLNSMTASNAGNPSASGQNTQQWRSTSANDVTEAFNPFSHQAVPAAILANHDQKRYQAGANPNITQAKQQQSGAGFSPALMSNPAFLQALRAMQSTSAAGPPPYDVPAMPGNWPLPGIETPEGSTGKAGTDCSGSAGGSPPSEVLPRTASQAAITGRQAQEALSRPKASLPGKKQAGDIPQQLRQGSNSSRSMHSHSASPEAELHQKRKASDDRVPSHTEHRSKGATSDDMDEQEDDSDEEESRTVGNLKRKGAAASSRRKSTAVGAAPLANVNEANLDPAERAARRKEQNRAAQKAFRERREQRVKDLEDRLAAMEAKAAGRDQENEELRQLLSKLQQENMNLQSGSFTFSGPLGGNPAAFDDNGRDTALNTVGKGASPLLSLTDSRMHGTTDAIPPLDRKDSSSGSGSTPASNANASSSSHADDSPGNFLDAQGPTGFHPDPYNAFAPRPKGYAAVGAFESRSGFASMSGSEQALSAGFGPGTNADSIFDQLQAVGGHLEVAKSPFTILAQNPEFTSFREPGYGRYEDYFGDSAMDGAQDSFEAEGAMEEFLRNFGGNPGAIHEVDQKDEPGASASASGTSAHALQSSMPGGIGFGSELFGSYFRGFGAKVLSPPASKGKSPQAFSPGDYLITSPDAGAPAPLESLTSAAEAAAMDIGVAEGHLDPLMSISTFGVTNASQDLLDCKILMRDGSYAPAGDVWQRIQAKLDFSNGFDLDDLCAQMKAKAVCTVSGGDHSKVMTEECIDDFVRDYEPIAVQSEAGVWAGDWKLKEAAAKTEGSR